MDTRNRHIPDRSGPGSTTAASSLGLTRPTTGGGGDKYTAGEAMRKSEVRNQLRQQKEEFTYGTWNVRTLNGEGKLEQLEHEMDRYRWNFLGIVEMRWLENGEMTTEKGHHIWFSGKEKKREEGVES